MRVGLVCPYALDHPGGVQNHVLGLAGWLRSQGHDVSIIGPGVPSPALLAANGLDDAQFRSSGPSVPITFNRSVARINVGARPLRLLREWLADGCFDLVHVHEPISPTISLWALRTATSPCVATFHAYSPNRWLVRFAHNLVPWAVRRIDAAIAVSSAAADFAEQETLRSPVIIGNGIDVASFPASQRPEPWRGGRRPRLVFVGRYDEPRKGFDVLVAALPTIRSVVPDLDVVVVGQGSRPQVPGVRFVSSDDAGRNAWLASADVYLAPHTGNESFGIVLLEALACGAPVVAADLPAFEEVLCDDEGLIGHTFATGDAHAAAAAVLASLAEPRDLRLDRGLARAAQFDWGVLGPQIVAQYDEAGRSFADSAR